MVSTRAAQAPPSAGPFALLREFRGPLVLATVAAVMALAGAGLTIRAAQLRGGPTAVNRALVDASATRQVIGVVSADVDQIFSYSYTDLGATRRAASAVLAGPAARQYSELFSSIEENAPAQKLTVTTRVVRAGVTRLDGNTAQLLVFLDQTSAGRDGRDAAQLSVTAQLIGGRWRITGIQSS